MFPLCMSFAIKTACQLVISYLDNARVPVLEPQSAVDLIINEVRCYEVQIEESEKGRQPPGVKPRTPLA